MVVIMVTLYRRVGRTPTYGSDNGDTVEESSQDPYLPMVVIMVTL